MIHQIDRDDYYPRSYDPPAPAERTIVCTCGWEFFTQESAGGGLEDWQSYWEDHQAAMACEEDA